MVPATSDGEVALAGVTEAVPPPPPPHAHRNSVEASNAERKEHTPNGVPA